MSTTRPRPIDALQRIMTSFKHFEKKLDKLQDDVNYHGQTLSDLRAMVTNLSGGTIINADGRFDDNRLSLKKNTAIQYEDKAYNEDHKMKRRSAMQPLPPPIKAKSLGSKLSPMTSPIHVHGTKTESPKTLAAKHSQRHRKAETARKANVLRNQNMSEKKRSKLTK